MGIILRQIKTPNQEIVFGSSSGKASSSSSFTYAPADDIITVGKYKHSSNTLVLTPVQRMLENDGVRPYFTDDSFIRKSMAFFSDIPTYANFTLTGDSSYFYVNYSTVPKFKVSISGDIRPSGNIYFETAGQSSIFSPGLRNFISMEGTSPVSADPDDLTHYFFKGGSWIFNYNQTAPNNTAKWSIFQGTSPNSNPFELVMEYDNALGKFWFKKLEADDLVLTNPLPLSSGGTGSGTLSALKASLGIPDFHEHLITTDNVNSIFIYSNPFPGKSLTFQVHDYLTGTYINFFAIGQDIVYNNTNITVTFNAVRPLGEAYMVKTIAF